MKFYYFNSTHWDREWYQGFQEYRKYLVDTVSVLFDYFDNVSEFDKYTFDGQTVFLEDIVEIRPDMKAKLVELISKKKLNVGPWYCMPDEFLVSGESIFRNWLIGRKIAKEYGATSWNVAYICDIFGHTSQFPQMINGFNFDGGVFWRGIDSNVGPYCKWQSPDGSIAKMIHLTPNMGYADYTMNVLNWSNRKLDEKDFKNRMANWVEKNQNYWQGTFVLSDAVDHTYPTKDKAKIFQWLREMYPNCEIIHDDYTQLFANEFNQDNEVIKDEQIHPCDFGDNVAWQISSTLSSRYDLKQKNDLLQNELESVIEPQLAMRSINGDTNANYLMDFAWKSLIKNHAHDSICGCSIDSVHVSMLTRFEDIRQINRTVTEELIGLDRVYLTGRTYQDDAQSNNFDKPTAELAEFAEDGSYTLRVFNSLPFDFKKSIEAELFFPAIKTYPRKMAEPFGYEFINCFKLFDVNGKELPYYIRSIIRNQNKAFYRQDCRRYDIYKIVFTGELIASTWNSFNIIASKGKVRYFDSLLLNNSTVSNGKIKLEINNDGTFDLTDLENNKCYSKQNNYQIDREIGDGWNHVRPVGNETISSSSMTQTRITVKSPIFTEFEITRTYNIPKSLNYNGTLEENYKGITESNEIVPLKIITRVGIDNYSKNVHVKTIIDNKVSDCRVQLLVPTYITGNYFANQMFNFIERVEGRTLGNESEYFHESEVIEKNFNGIVGKTSEQGGIAFINDAGLHEAGCLTDSDSSLVITLFRSFRRAYQTNGQIDGQLNKRLEFKYMLNCFKSADYAILQNLQQIEKTQYPNYLIKSEFINPLQVASMLKISSNLAYSTVKPTCNNEPNSMIVRVFNPSNAKATGEIDFGFNANISSCMMDETIIVNIAQNVNKTKINIAPWQIVSLRIDKV